jgi:uncharacterized SAM-binding protein YcdF (DUF218 family)
VACALHGQGWAPWILLSGGGGRGKPIEAEQMAEEARRQGIGAHHLLLEPHATNTWENAEFSAALLRRRGLTTAIVVTHPFHTRRVLRALLRHGVLPRACPVPRSWMDRGDRDALQLVLREYLALFVDLTGGRR